MARFCTRCGRPLEEGEVCNCGQEAAQQQVAPQPEVAQQQAAPQPEAVQQQAAPQPEAVQQQAAPQFQQQTQQQAAPQFQQQAQQQGYAQNSQQFQQTQQAVTGFLGKMFGSFLNIIKHPVTGGRDVILAGGVAVGSALMVLQGILTAIFAAIGANKAFGDMVGVVSYFSSDDVKIPYVKIIFLTLILSVILSFVLALLLFLGNLIMKNTVSFTQMIGAASLRSSVVIITNILAIIVCLINPVGGMLVFAIGNIWGFFVILQAMPIATEAMRNKLPLVMILVYFVFMLANYFCVKQGYTGLLGDMGSLSGLGSLGNLW